MCEAVDRAGIPARIYHAVQRSLWRGACEDGRDYRPPTYEADGFIHACQDQATLVQILNQFYKGIEGEFCCLEIDTAVLMSKVIMEGPAGVGDQSLDAGSKAQVFAHIYGPISPLKSVIADHSIERDADGTFLRVKEKARLPIGWGERTSSRKLEQLSNGIVVANLTSKGGAAANVEYEGLVHESTKPVKNISGENTAVKNTSDLTPSGIPLGWSERSHSKSGGFGSHSWDEPVEAAVGGTSAEGGFISSSAWEGSKEGMVFKQGPQGLGYYTDTPGGDVTVGHEELSEEELHVQAMERVASSGGKTFQVQLDLREHDGMGIDVEEGAGISSISSLIPGGAAEAVSHPLMGELRQGDIIRYVNGRPVMLGGLRAVLDPNERSLQLTVQRVVKAPKQETPITAPPSAVAAASSQLPTADGSLQMSQNPDATPEQVAALIAQHGATLRPSALKHILAILTSSSTEHSRVMALIAQLGATLEPAALNHIMAILTWELPLSRL